jgi:hypothetical protein
MNEVGTGKTYTMMLSVELKYKRLLARQAAGKKVLARPTLFVVPANLVAQTFQECQEAFPDLKFHCFYGSAAQLPVGHPRRAATIQKPQLDDKMVEWDADDDNPETASHVVITAYTTLSMRCVKRTKIRYNVDAWDGAWVFDQSVPLERTRARALREVVNSDPDTEDDDETEVDNEEAAFREIQEPDPPSDDDEDESESDPDFDPADYQDDAVFATRTGQDGPSTWCDAHGWGSIAKSHPE